MSKQHHTQVKVDDCKLEVERVKGALAKLPELRKAAEASLVGMTEPGQITAQLQAIDALDLEARVLSAQLVTAANALGEAEQAERLRLIDELETELARAKREWDLAEGALKTAQANRLRLSIRYRTVANERAAAREAARKYRAQTAQ